MDYDFERFVEEVREKNPIDEVIEKTAGEWGLGSLRGVYRRGQTHDSLVVNTRKGFYVWNDMNEHGDVFTWLQARNGWDFMTSLRWLAARVGMEIPHRPWSPAEVERHAAARSIEDAWGVAQRMFAEWLWKDETPQGGSQGSALGYARGRGWSDETIREAGIGFSGRGKPGEFAEMRGALSAAGVDLECPAAVAVLGFSGDVRTWAKKYNLSPADNWVESRYISGMMSKTRIVYAHYVGGRVRYLSGRNILGAEVYQEDPGSKKRIVKSWNPPVELVGKRQAFYNQAYVRGNERCVVVEGQGDAVALGEMGCPAAATMGTSWQDMTVMLRELRERHKELYLGVHGDEAGLKMLRGDKHKPWPLATIMGAMGRVVFWPVVDPESKDANDWLREMKGGRKGSGDQGDLTPQPPSLNGKGEEEDALLGEASEWAKTESQVSLAKLQWHLKIGYTRAARLVDVMEKRGIIRLPQHGSLERQVIRAGNMAQVEEVPQGDAKTAEIASQSLAMTEGSMPSIPTGDPREELERVLGASRPFILLMAGWAGGLTGAEHDAAEQTVCELAATLEGVTYTQYRMEIAGELRRSGRELDGLIKQIQLAAKKKEKELGEPVETVGGWYEDHLVEMLYNIEENTTSLAVRYPDGHVEETDHVTISGIRYIPMAPQLLITRQMVSFPSKVAAARPTRELVGIVRMYIHRYLEIDPFYEKMASYYVLFTWLYDSFIMTPYLRALGDYGTGKTRFIETIGGVCYRPIHTAGVASTASIFRLLETYRGTLILDEADFSQSDETVEIIKILNVGNKKGGNVIRAMDMGNGNIQPVPYNVYGPKVIATRKKFGDEATESRCLTKEMGSGLVRQDIQLVEGPEFYSQALEIRNLLLAYRMKYWNPEALIDYNSADRSIEPRLNQVTLPLKTIVGKDEPDLLEEIDGFIRRYNDQLMVERSMRPEAKVLEAIVELGKKKPEDKAKQEFLIGGENDLTPQPPSPEGKGELISLSLKAICERTNEIMNKENEADETDKFGKKLTPKGTGNYIRNKLQLATERKNSGYFLVWDEERIGALKRRYGID